MNKIETRLDEMERKWEWRNSEPEVKLASAREPEAGLRGGRRVSEEVKNNRIKEFFDEGAALTARTTDTEESAFSMDAEAGLTTRTGTTRGA